MGDVRRVLQAVGLAMLMILACLIGGSAVLLVMAGALL